MYNQHEDEVLKEMVKKVIHRYVKQYLEGINEEVWEKIVHPEKPDEDVMVEVMYNHVYKMFHDDPELSGDPECERELADIDLGNQLADALTAVQDVLLDELNRFVPVMEV